MPRASRSENLRSSGSLEPKQWGRAGRGCGRPASPGAAAARSTGTCGATHTDVSVWAAGLRPRPSENRLLQREAVRGGTRRLCSPSPWSFVPGPRGPAQSVATSCCVTPHPLVSPQRDPDSAANTAGQVKGSGGNVTLAGYHVLPPGPVPGRQGVATPSPGLGGCRGGGQNHGGLGGWRDLGCLQDLGTGEGWTWSLSKTAEGGRRGGVSPAQGTENQGLTYWKAGPGPTPA